MYEKVDVKQVVKYNLGSSFSSISVNNSRELLLFLWMATSLVNILIFKPQLFDI